MNELTVVCEHSNSLKTIDNIKTVIEYAKQNDLQFMHPNQVLPYFNNKLNGRFILLTFDDGLEYHYPEIPILLRQNNIHALVFLFPLKPNMHELSTNFNFYIENKDVFTVGCHSLTHAMIVTSPEYSDKKITGPKFKYYGMDNQVTWKHGLINKEYNLLNGKYENESQYLIRMEHELAFSKDWLERAFGTSISSFAYPYGVYDKTVMDLIKKYGYDFAFSVIQTNYNRFTIPRLYVEHLSKNLKPKLVDGVPVICK
jgi:biofilm PGA synthesis lipoprotein PgaB